MDPERVENGDGSANRSAFIDPNDLLSYGFLPPVVDLARAGSSM